jgi:hypothetical protein
LTSFCLILGDNGIALFVTLEIRDDEIESDEGEMIQWLEKFGAE